MADIEPFVEAALSSFVDKGALFEFARHHFPTDPNWRACTQRNIEIWKASISWKLGSKDSYDLVEQSFTVCYKDQRLYMGICQQVARLFMFHFAGITQMPEKKWFHLGNLIGFNGSGMDALQSPSPVDNAPSAAAPKAVTAPSKPGATRRVWEIASSMPGMARGAVLAACAAEGINPNTAGTQYAKWKKAQ